MATGKEALAKLIAGAEKKYDFPVAPMSKIATTTQFISTRNMAIDYVIGGGIPLGRVIEIAGLPSSGKTTTALQAGANLQAIIKNGGDKTLGITEDDKILYLDYEQAMDPEYAKALGLDTDDDTFLFGQPASLEKGGNLSLEMGKTGLIRMIIVDSVAAMQSETALANEVGAHNVGTQAKFVTDYITKMNVVAKENNIAVILINHTKEKIGMGGRPGAPPVRTTPGGVGAKYFASVRLEYEPRKQYKQPVYDPVLDDTVDQVVANDVLVKAIKNKIAPPYRKQLVKVRYGKGFDNFFTAITVLIAHKKIMYSTGMFYFHKVAEEGGAPEWMTRTANGNKRPYIKGEANLYAAAEKDPEWSELIQLMGEAIIYETPDPNAVVDDEEEEAEHEAGEAIALLGASESKGNKVSL